MIATWFNPLEPQLHLLCPCIVREWRQLPWRTRRRCCLCQLLAQYAGGLLASSFSCRIFRCYHLLDNFITQCLLELVELDEAVTIAVDLIEDSVDVLGWCVVPHPLHAAAELLLVEAAIAIVIPLAEEVDERYMVLFEDVP